MADSDTDGEEIGCVYKGEQFWHSAWPVGIALAPLWIFCVLCFSVSQGAWGQYIQVAQAWWTLHVSHYTTAKQLENWTGAPLVSENSRAWAWSLFAAGSPVVITMVRKRYQGARLQLL